MEIAPVAPLPAESLPTTEAIEASRPKTNAEEFGARFERFLGGLSADLFRPESILLMGLGSAAFRVARFAALAKLTASPAAGFFTRGLGARASAAAVGWLAETNTFTLGHSVLAKAAGRPSNFEGFAKDWASNALLMGSLRSFGSLASSFASPRTLELTRQAGLFAAIGLSHRIETKLGWRAPGLNPWEETFLTWIHFNVGAAVAKRALGPSFQAWEKKTEFFSENLQLPPASLSFSKPAFGLTLLAAPTKASLSPKSASNLNLLSTGGGKVVLHPKLSRFQSLWENPKEVTIADIKFWAKELSADPTDPRRSLQAMRIIQRTEDTKAQYPQHVVLAKEVIQTEIAKVGSKQLKLVRDASITEQENGRPIVHGCRFIELVAFLHPSLLMRLKAAWMRREFDKRFERSSQGHPELSRLSEAERARNFEEAVMLRDETYIDRWYEFSVPNRANISEDFLQSLREHPNAIVREGLINRLMKLGMADQHFQSWWGENELARIHLDIASGEKMRKEKAFTLLRLHASLGHREAGEVQRKYEEEWLQNILGRITGNSDPFSSR